MCLPASHYKYQTAVLHVHGVHETVHGRRRKPLVAVAIGEELNGEGIKNGEACIFNEIGRIGSHRDRLQTKL